MTDVVKRWEMPGLFSMWIGPNLNDKLRIWVDAVVGVYGIPNTPASRKRLAQTLRQIADELEAWKVIRRTRIGNGRTRKGITRAARPRRQRKSTVGALKRRLWRLFSAYVKARDGNVCFTCGAQGLEGKNWQAGHCIRKDGHASVAYDPKNVHSQCGRCNLWERGNAGVHATKIERIYGPAEWERILLRSQNTKHWTAPELRDLIAALERGPAEYECLYYERYL